MVLGFWRSFLDGLEVSLLFPRLFTVGLGFFLMGCTSAEIFGSCFQACIVSCSFLPIAPDSSLVPTVSGRVRGFLARGRRDGLLPEVVWLYTAG